MSLVEFLRARNAFIIVAAILAVLVVGNTLLLAWAVHTHGIGSNDTHASSSGHSIRISVDGSDDDVIVPSKKVADVKSVHDLGFTVPLGALLGLAGYVAIAFATILGTSLNKENTLGGFAFTKPISRERLALLYFAVDAGAIAAIFLLALALAFVPLVALGILDKLVVDPQALPIVALSLGTAAMWYGLLQALTSSLRMGGGMFIGIGWGTFLILAALFGVTELGPVLHPLVVALNYLNPLAYYTALTTSGSAATPQSLLPLGEPVRVAVTWSLGILGCALAALGWKRVEV